MRRLSSIFISAATAAALITATASGASAAPGDSTVKTAGVVAPSSVPNASILRLARLNKTNSFLVAGIDTSTAGANMHLWRTKEDLTLDSTSKPIDLGNTFELPTASNSTCMANSMMANSGTCYRIESLAVNETTDTFAIAYSKNVSVGSGMNSRSADIISISIGKLSTGAVTASGGFFRNTTPSYNPATDFASFGATDILSNLCATNFGASYQNIALSGSSTDMRNFLIRPDGSLVLGISCSYNTTSGSSATEYSTSALIALKPSGTNIVRDTSWGTNGITKTYDDASKCGLTWSTGLTDTSITSMTSSKVFAVISVQNFARVTQYPFGGGGITNYNGCGTTPSTQYTSSTLLAVKADGTLSASSTLTPAVSPGRWVIDPNGRWNSILSGSGSTPTYSVLRLNTKGEPDTTLGTNGQKVLTGLPSSVTVNGTSVTMRYSLLGVATTAKGFMFTGFSSSTTQPNMFNCNQASNYETTSYPYYLTIEDGLVTSYGTNGLGQGVTTQYVTTDMCGSGTAGVSYINSKGQHAQMQAVRAIGTQKAGLKYSVWAAADGVTSGGDGSGVIGGSAAGRIDKKVYSTKLPAATQADSALTVLTAKQAEDLDIRTNTPKICIALTTSVVMVNPGRCSVRIIDEDTKKVIRTMTTIVKKTEVADGTTLTTDEPIYFRQASTRLSKNALAQVAELATAAKDAARVVIIGHSAALGEVSEYSYAISRNRANAVKAALIKAGVKTPIEIVAMAYSQPEKTAKTEKAQALNRRAEVYIFPK